MQHAVSRIDATRCYDFLAIRYLGTQEEEEVEEQEEQEEDEEEDTMTTC